jgi:subtilisin family serine protease
MLKTYNVALNEGVDYDAFWNEIETNGLGSTYVPNRSVSIANARPTSLRQCWYELSEEETEKLRNDPRVYCVEIPPEHRTDIQIKHNVVQTGLYYKVSGVNPANNLGINWGLFRLSSTTNNTPGTLGTLDYNYTLDGTGVDVVIQDGGCQINHPEFTDANNESRVQQINWYTASGLGGTQNANHYRDYSGHGTHVAGIAAGKTFGWAKNANVYSLKVNGLEGTGDSGTGISISDCFDVIKLWHRNKPVQASTGKKRPTIVNMSWGYSLTYTSVSSVTYRGNTFSDASTTGNAGYRWTNYGLVNLTNGGNFVTNFRQGQVDVDIQEMIDEGIHVIIAAGNNYHKIDTPTGEDYNNYVTFGGTDYYYHRGSSPLDDQAVKVGSIDNNVFAANLDQVSNFSEKGPGVDMWAPGSNVMSACSNTNEFSAVSYSKDSGFKQVSISGTSMAAPQVCGVGALYLQMNPGINPGQMKTWLTNIAEVTSVIYTTNTSNDYTTTRSLLGAPNKFLYNPFGIESDGSMSGSVTLTNGAFTLT